MSTTATTEAPVVTTQQTGEPGFHIRQSSKELDYVREWVIQEGQTFALRRSGEITVSFISGKNITGITWSSSDSAVATVDGSGFVKANELGTAVISAEISGDESRTVQFTVDVNKKEGSEKIGDHWYFINGSEVKLTGLVPAKNPAYYCNEEGIMQSGMVVVDGKMYYFKPDGNGKPTMVKKDWIEFEKDRWYYAQDDGTLATGVIEIEKNGEKKKYQFDENGVWIP